MAEADACPSGAGQGRQPQAAAQHQGRQAAGAAARPGGAAAAGADQLADAAPPALHIGSPGLQGLLMLCALPQVAVYAVWVNPRGHCLGV